MNESNRNRTTGVGGVKIGTELNQTYMIDSLIGVGGMGEVFRGHNIQTGDPVAIKIVLPEFARDEMILELFRKEARILNHLAHDAIVRYYVFSIDRSVGRPYLAMEYVDGPSLAEKVKAAPLSDDDVAVLQIRLADGLQKAHEAGVIHRDMSPDNVILPSSEVKSAKIIDFGIARSANVGGATLLGGSFAGKYNYVSPEQLGLYGGEVTPKSDIYSLALVLITALRGRPLDMSGSQVEVIEKRRVVPDLSDVSPRFRELLQAMLQPDPAARPASMADVRDWKTVAVPPQPIQADDATVIKRPAPPVAEEPPKPEKVIIQPRSVEPSPAADSSPGGPNYLVLGAILAAVIALGVLGGWLFVQRGTTDQTVQTADIPITKPTTPVTPPETKVEPEKKPDPVLVTPTTPVTPPETKVEPEKKPDPVPETPKAPVTPPALTTAALEEFVNAYAGGACFHASARTIGNGTAELSAFARDESGIEKLKGDFTGKAGFAPNVTINTITDPQCPAIDVVGKLTSPGSQPLRIVMAQDSQSGGAAASGSAGKIVLEASVLNAGKRNVSVLLITDDGGVQNINRACGKCLSFSGDELKVRVPLVRPPTASGADTGSGVRPLLLLAVASPRNVLSISDQNIYSAANVFPALANEVEGAADISAAVGYFKF